jgi:hypothetical protein
MDVDFWMVVVFAVGVLTLFLFPEPESNFIWYVLTGLGFGGLIGALFWLRKVKK